MPAEQQPKNRHWAIGLVIVAVGALFGAERWLVNAPLAAPTEASPAAAPSAGAGAIDAAFRARRSDVWVESNGRAVRLLADDNEGSRHQKMIVRVEGGQTILLSHNIDLAPRVPLSVGDEIQFRGEYEWNEKGGVVHWTHHDPQGRHQGGWIRHGGETYR